MSQGERETSQPTEQKNHEPPHHASSFTAVNGRTSPHVNGNQQPEQTTHASPPRTESYPPNGNSTSKTASESVKSSPSVKNYGPSSSESEKSPPIRKRSHPEAFGEPERRGYPQHPAPETPRSGEYPRHELNGSEQDGQKPPPNEFDPHAPLGQNYYPPRSQAQGDNEQRLAAEALRRESETSNMHREQQSALANGDDLRSQQYSEFDRTPSGVQMDQDRKRRKRVFSNRTKTGCMTCRRRKKKCDEAHPECEWFQSSPEP
jgi:hypothetical protein